MARTNGAKQQVFKWRLYKKRLDGVEEPIGDYRNQQELAEAIGYKNGCYFNSIMSGKRKSAFHHQYRVVNLCESR